MKKPLIAIDVDDVLAVERDAIRKFINDTYGLSLTAEDYAVPGPYWGYWEHVWGVDGVTAGEWYGAYIDAGIKGTHQVAEGAIEVIEALKNKYRLAVVTSREDKAFATTHEWLDRHFPETFEHVEFVTLWDKDRKVSKAKICEDLGASYLIDDNIEHCNLAAEAGITALLYGDYGWNRDGELHEALIRMQDWPAIGAYFEART